MLPYYYWEVLDHISKIKFVLFIFYFITVNYSNISGFTDQFWLVHIYFKKRVLKKVFLFFLILFF